MDSLFTVVDGESVFDHTLTSEQALKLMSWIMDGYAQKWERRLSLSADTYSFFMYDLHDQDPHAEAYMDAIVPSHPTALESWTFKAGAKVRDLVDGDAADVLQLLNIKD